MSVEKIKSDEDSPKFQIICSKQKELDVLQSDVRSIKKELNNGLKMKVAMIQKDQEYIKKSVDEFTKVNGSLLTAINGLQLFKKEIEVKKDIAKDEDTDHKAKRKYIATIITATIASASAVGMFILSLIDKI